MSRAPYNYPLKTFEFQANQRHGWRERKDEKKQASESVQCRCEFSMCNTYYNLEMCCMCIEHASMPPGKLIFECCRKTVGNCTCLKSVVQFNSQLKKTKCCSEHIISLRKYKKLEQNFWCREMNVFSSVNQLHSHWLQKCVHGCRYGAYTHPMCWGNQGDDNDKF